LYSIRGYILRDGLVDAIKYSIDHEAATEEKIEAKIKRYMERPCVILQNRPAKNREVKNYDKKAIGRKIQNRSIPTNKF
jgi:DNA-directed RNA polymerase subunit L